MADERKQSWLAQTAQNIGGGLLGQAANGIFGMFMQRHNDRRQLRQQQKLMDMQTSYDMRMKEFERQQQMRMWEDTNYAAQVAQMKKAGLNPGMLYGMGGAGGATTGGGSGGGVNAPAAPMGGGEIMGMLQLRTQEAQIKLMEAQAKKAEADANKTGGVDTENVKANTANIQLQTAMRKIEKEIMYLEWQTRKDTFDVTIKKIADEADKIHAEMEETKMRTGMLSANYETLIKNTAAQLSGLILENALKEQQKTVNAQTIEKIKEEIKTMKGQLDVNRKQLIINMLKQEVDEKNTPIWTVLGRRANEVADGIEKAINKMFGGTGETQTEKRDKIRGEIKP